MLGEGRGAFILFEGIDRCGKSTQSSMLSQFLSITMMSELIRFPNRTSCIGQLINSYLASTSDMNDQTIHLLFSANRWEASKEIESKLASGCTLVCDRYAYSGVSFSAAKGLDFEWCKSCDYGLPAPDCIIYLDMPVEEAAKRGHYGEERYEKVELQLKVRENFMKMKDSDATKLPWYTLDASRSIEELHEEIKLIATNTIRDIRHKEISRLWL
eukprot:gene5215-10435_t